VSRRSQDYDRLEVATPGGLSAVVYVCRACKSLVADMRGHDRWHLSLEDRARNLDVRTAELGKRVTKLGQDITSMTVKLGRVKR
jgi:hypothetical protein